MSKEDFHQHGNEGDGDGDDGPDFDGFESLNEVDLATLKINFNCLKSLFGIIRTKKIVLDFFVLGALFCIAIFAIEHSQSQIANTCVICISLNGVFFRIINVFEKKIKNNEKENSG